MEIFNPIFFFCLGAVFASFLNLFVFRIENEYPLLGIFTGRSFCESCKKDLKWFELIPIFSFIFLKGKCSECKKNIGFFNLFSEFFLALVFFLFAIFDFSFVFFFFLLILYFWAVYDFHFESIPKKITDVIFLLSFFYWVIALAFDFNINKVYPVFIALLLGLIVYLISLRKTIFGFGDIIVVVILALWLNLEIFLSTLFYSFVVGGIFGLFLVIKDRRYLKKYIPFLPFILFGFVLALLLSKVDFNLLEYVISMC